MFKPAVLQTVFMGLLVSLVGMECKGNSTDTVSADSAAKVARIVRDACFAIQLEFQPQNLITTHVDALRDHNGEATGQIRALEQLFRVFKGPGNSYFWLGCGLCRSAKGLESSLLLSGNECALAAAPLVEAIHKALPVFRKAVAEGGGFRYPDEPYRSLRSAVVDAFDNTIRVLPMDDNRLDSSTNLEPQDE